MSMIKAGINERNEVTVALYRKLYLMRRTEEGIIKYYPQDDMKTPMHMSMGQEAISAGVCHALKLKDQIWTTYRSHAALLAKTENIDAFFAELYGKVLGPSGGKAGSMHLADPERGHMMSSAVVASNIPVAMGAAFANKQKKNGLISCAFFGDGALDEGVFWESLNVACVMKLPVLFVCEDNGLAVHTSTRQRQGYQSILDVVSKFNCEIHTNDSNDVEQIYELSRRTTQEMRTVSRPVFLHFKCFRYLEHVGIYEDFNAGYRSKSAYESWLKCDCLATQKKRLLEQGLEEEVLQIESVVDQQVENAIKQAQEAPFPKPEDLQTGVFYERD